MYVCMCARAGMIERGLPDSSHYHPKSSQSESADIIKSVDLTENTEVFIAEPTANQAEGSTGAKGSPSSPDWLDSEWESLDPLEEEEEEEKQEQGGGQKMAPTECIESESTAPITVQPKATPAQTDTQTYSATQTQATHPHTPLQDVDPCGLPPAIFTKVLSHIWCCEKIFAHFLISFFYCIVHLLYIFISNLI